jgi:hypothetical protein
MGGRFANHAITPHSIKIDGINCINDFAAAKHNMLHG